MKCVGLTDFFGVYCTYFNQLELTEIETDTEECDVLLVVNF